MQNEFNLIDSKTRFWNTYCLHENAKYFGKHLVS